MTKVTFFIERTQSVSGLRTDFRIGAPQSRAVDIFSFSCFSYPLALDTDTLTYLPFVWQLEGPAAQYCSMMG
jgi:hypothetical protein